MTLNGIGEPAPTLIQVATQAVKIELFTQWQTYQNGVHMDSDTFDSIDFRSLALAVITATGITVTADEVAEDMPKLRKLLAQPTPFAPGDALGRTVDYPQPGSEAWNEHMKQVQG